MPRFELTTLSSYDDDSLIQEIRRVVDALPHGIVTRKMFDRLARVSSSTLIKRFGGWQETLVHANRANRYGGRTVSRKMRKQDARLLSNDELIRELKLVAQRLGKKSLTMDEFSAGSSRVSASSLRRRFGSWKNALNEAGLRVSPLGRRYTLDQYFENILEVWTHYGRQPKYREMDASPSTITSGGYAAKFGGWRKALAAFVSRVEPNQLKPEGLLTSKTTSPRRSKNTGNKSSRIRKIPIGLRYNVLRRDNFKCVLCGSNPAADPSCMLHVDHVKAFSRGGLTEIDNLRTLCSKCNVGKSNKIE